MKNVNAFLLILAYAAMASSAATPVAPAAGAAAVCGDLGILNIAPGDLPEGVEPSELRLCADHPMGRNRTLDPAEGASLAPMTEEEDLEPDTTPAAGASLFEERACYYKAPYGCSRGYCWKSCGKSRSGQWCWTASAGGGGPWNKCDKFEDCGTNRITQACGNSCWVSRACGCSC
ncbi:uncharacterized protein FIESC28_01769 [Fusarium coffeatum]|uniref:Uncharacterized protein n=1 Tax=Fusarium coffeatum TaxID=231269 RepID=A0A366S8L3_9HYPO|nr:uncharacterized protein FIESC28_01769 [Fusarium coffeatum]RBR25332.1 hypothetical protein FIESC28_01769 [Fusarium coffeatum]